ncbi:hypothetical protein ACSBR1_014982 [Camellia fascicularis]
MIFEISQPRRPILDTYRSILPIPIFCDRYQLWYRHVVSGGKTPRLFLGSSYRAGDDPDPAAGSLENIPHGPVHIWCGDRTQPNLEDMGNLYSTGRDPIFYSHHANVDRIWTVWKTLGGKRNDFKYPDWLNSEFTFYDENA